MAKYVYNTFVVMDCKKRKPVMVTSSARKAAELLEVGRRIEVWNANMLVEKIHAKEKRERYPMRPYIQAEKDHIAQKQKRAEMRNCTRRMGDSKWRINRKKRIRRFRLSTVSRFLAEDSLQAKQRGRQGESARRRKTRKRVLPPRFCSIWEKLS